jgi:hypothetical protein
MASNGPGHPFLVGPVTAAYLQMDLALVNQAVMCATTTDCLARTDVAFPRNVSLEFSTMQSTAAVTANKNNTLSINAAVNLANGNNSACDLSTDR